MKQHSEVSCKGSNISHVSVLKREAVDSSEMMEPLHQTTRITSYRMVNILKLQSKYFDKIKNIVPPPHENESELFLTGTYISFEAHNHQCDLISCGYAFHCTYECMIFLSSTVNSEENTRSYCELPLA
jgi:hypothetical protein